MGTAVHAHEGDGTTHVEADTVGRELPLGQLFTQWGVALTRPRTGGVRTEAGQTAYLTSNGTPVTGNPADLRLEPNQQIELALPCPGQRRVRAGFPSTRPARLS